MYVCMYDCMYICIANASMTSGIHRLAGVRKDEFREHSSIIRFEYYLNIYPKREDLMILMPSGLAISCCMSEP